MNQQSSSSSSSQSTAYANSQGAGGSSSSLSTSPTGENSSSQQSAFVPGAPSASANANANSSNQGAETSAEVSVPASGGTNTSGTSENASAGQEENGQEGDEDHSTGSNGSTPSSTESGNTPEASNSIAPEVVLTSLLLGTTESDNLVLTNQQDIVFGGQGADSFEFDSAGVTDLNQADVILDFDTTSGDRLALGESVQLTASTNLSDILVFEVVDFDGNGVVDSTVLRSVADNSILGVVLNTVAFETVDDQTIATTTLSVADFAPAATDASTTPEQSTGSTGGSNSSSSSSSFVDETGAGSDSAAIATDSNGNTTSDSDSAYQGEATSSSGGASASASSDETQADAIANTPASSSDMNANLILDTDTDTYTPAFQIGTNGSDIVTGTENKDFMVGNAGADVFMLTSTGQPSLDSVDIVIDFSADQDDLIQIVTSTDLNSITLQAVDINGDGNLDGTSIGNGITGEIYAVVLNTIDTLGATTLAISQDIVIAAAI